MPPRIPKTIAVPTNNRNRTKLGIRWFTSRYSVVKVLNQRRGSRPRRWSGRLLFTQAVRARAGRPAKNRILERDQNGGNLPDPGVKCTYPSAIDGPRYGRC